MRATGLVVWVILLLMVIPGAAHASAPVPGGRYVDRIHEQGASGRIKLTLANDGLEFADPSYVYVARCFFGVGLTGSMFSPRAVAVDGDGRFRHAAPFPLSPVSIRGRFTRGGRLAVGRVTGVGSPSLGSRSCRRRISFRFRARLTGTPNAARPGFPSSCDPVTFRRGLGPFDPRSEDSYEPSEQGIGCTTARQLARQWHRSSECTALTGPGATCSLGAATCETIPLGSWLPLARIRCSTPERPGGATELVYLRACNGTRDFSVKAINVDCRTARSFPSEQTLETDGPCGNIKRVASRHPVTCAPIAGYVCTVTVDIKEIAFSARCVEEQTRSVGLVLDYEYPG